MPLLLLNRFNIFVCVMNDLVYWFDEIEYGIAKLQEDVRVLHSIIGDPGKAIATCEKRAAMIKRAIKSAKVEIRSLKGSHNLYKQKLAVARTKMMDLMEIVRSHKIKPEKEVKRSNILNCEKEQSKHPKMENRSMLDRLLGVQRKGKSATQQTAAEFSKTTSTVNKPRAMDKRIIALCFDDLRASLTSAYMKGTRLWCFEAVKQWLGDGTSPKLFWLMGGGGTGKSVVSAQIIEMMKDSPEFDLAWHFCLHSNPTDNTPLKIMISIAAQLCDLDADFRAKFLEEKNLAAVFSGQISMLHMFDILLKLPMEALGARSKKLLVVIDALDELPHDGTQDRVLRLLTEAFLALPDWVKVFTTSREESSIKVKLSKFKPMELRVDDERNLRDVELYFRAIAKKYVKSSWTFEMLEKDIEKVFGLNLEKGILKEKIGDAFKDAMAGYDSAFDEVSIMDGYDALLEIQDQRPPRVQQVSSEFNRIMKDAAKAQKAIAKKLARKWEPKLFEDGKPKIVNRKTGQKLLHPKVGQAADWIDEAYNPGPKSRERAQEKVEKNFGGDASQLTDVCRFTIEFKSAVKLLDAVVRVFPEKLGRIVRLKNKHQNPTPLGHRDFNINFEMNLGKGRKHIFEIQANLTPCIKAQKENHKFYEVVRSELPGIVGKDIWKKVFRHITDRLSESTLESTVKLFTENADGLMVYAKLLAANLESAVGLGKRMEVAALLDLSKGLEELYEANFNRIIDVKDLRKNFFLGSLTFKQKAAYASVFNIIAMIIVACEPLPAAILLKVIGDEEFNCVLKEKMSILFPIRNDGRVHVMHKSMIDWLDTEFRRYLIILGDFDLSWKKETAHVKLGEVCGEIVGVILSLGEETIISEGNHEIDVSYAFKYGVTHMCAAGNVAAARALLMNFDWLIMRARLGQWKGVCDDARSVLECSKSDDRAMEMLASAVYLAQPALAKEEGWMELPGQLVGRLMGYAKRGKSFLAEIESLLKRVRRWRGCDWWCPVLPTMVPAGSSCSGVFADTKVK